VPLIVEVLSAEPISLPQALNIPSYTEYIANVFWVSNKGHIVRSKPDIHSPVISTVSKTKPLRVTKVIEEKGRRWGLVHPSQLAGANDGWSLLSDSSNSLPENHIVYWTAAS
jgi:hypothetical protein